MSDTHKHGSSIKFVVAAVIVIVAIIAGIAYYAKMHAPPKSVVFNNYVFNYTSDKKWHTQQLIKNQLYDIPFYHNPQETLDINLDDPRTILKIYNTAGNPNATVYVTIHPNETSRVVVAAVEYVRLLGTSYNIFNMNVKSALSAESDKTAEQPIITCENSSPDVLVINQFVGNKNSISSKGNCILLESMNATESIRVADAFAFRLLTIVR